MNKVCVRYEETRAGRTALACALDFANIFSSDPLQVYAPRNYSAVELLLPLVDDAERMQQTRIESAAKQLTPAAEIEVCAYDDEHPPYPAKATVADYKLGKRRSDINVLYPARESSLESRQSGPVLIPFSDEDSGLVAATLGFHVVEQWRRTRLLLEDQPEVILYHTTWTDPDAPSQDAIDQMSESAQRVMLSLEATAKRRGIRYKTIIETHDDVVQGAIECAQAQSCVLMVMSRGARITQGSYVERTLEQSPVPVLVASAGTTKVAEPVGDAELQQFRASRKHAFELRKEAPAKPIWQKLIELPVLRSPVFVMGLVAAMYVLKAIFKISIGSWVNSPMVTGDGFHNLADLLEAAAVIVVLLIARRPTTDKYPYGRKNIEWFTSLAIGVMLFGAAGKFIIDCCVGLLSYWHSGDTFVRSYIPILPEHQTLHMDGSTFPYVLGVTLVSFLFSLVVSRYQIVIGKRSGHASLIADGEETASDGWIEGVTVCGVIAEFATGWGFLEYVLGLLVAAMILRTARELFVTGWRVLLQHSIGKEHEDAARELCRSVRGVSNVGDLKTFQVGHTAVIMLTIESMENAHGIEYIKRAVELSLRKYLLSPQSDFKGCDIHVKVQRPEANRHRIGYALIVRNGVGVIAPSFNTATHVAVCDVEHGDVVRTKVWGLESDPFGLLVEKRVSRLYVYTATALEAARLQRETTAKLAARNAHGVIPVPTLAQANCFALPLLGLEI